MPSLRLLALFAPVLLVLPAACEDSSSSSGGPFNAEGGPGFEAGPPADAGPLPDAAVDALPVGTKGIRVLVLDGPTPQQDVRVILHDATGAVIGDLKTDAAGKVSSPSAPSMVTVLGASEIPEQGTRRLPTTFMGVADGDNLVVDLNEGRLGPTSVGQYNVSFGAPVANATDYNARVGTCSGGTFTPATPLLLDVDTSCTGAKNAVLATASLDNGVAIAFGFVKDVAKPAAGTPINVGPIAFTASGSTKVTAANLPVNETHYGALFAIVNSAAYPATIASGTLEQNDLTFATATGFAEAYQASVSSQVYSTGTNRKTLLRRETAAPASATLAFDFASALPSITSVAVDRTALARQKITFASSASLAGADGAVFALDWFPAGLGGGRWTFVVPASTTTFTVPALPADASDFVPNGTTNLNELAFVESSLLPGYADFKKLPVSPAGLSVIDASNPLPSAGTVRILHWDSSD